MARPKPPKNLPFFLTELGSKVKVALSMSGPTESSLRQYLAWASEAAKGQNLSHEELEARFMDRIIKDAIKRDKLFQEATRKRGAKEEATGSEGPIKPDKPFHEANRKKGVKEAAMGTEG